MAESTAKKSTAKRTTKKTATKGRERSAAAKETPAKETTAAKKAPAKKTTAAKKSAGNRASSQGAPPPRKARARAEPRPASSRDGRQGGSSRVAKTARDAVRDLTGKEPESVIGIDRRDTGWTVEVEVLELQRIPTTTDVMATYEVELDGDGELQGYRRVQRYVRGSAGGDRT